MQFLAWDQKSRNHVDISDFPPDYQGNKLVGKEFNHKAVNQLVFEEDEISVYSNPAFHYDTPGPVSLRLEWKGFSVTYSGRQDAAIAFERLHASSASAMTRSFRSTS